MENDEITDELEVTIPDEQELELEESTDEASDDSVQDGPTELEKAQAEAAKWRRLAQKTQKKPEAIKPKADSKPSPVSVDERILKSQGMSDELLDELKVIAEIRGIDLIEAQTDHLFVATKEKYERDQKSKQASMGSSRGSGQPAAKKAIDTPGLSLEEHKAMAKEAMSKL